LLFDTHCHLNLNSFQDDLEQVLLDARENDVSMLVVPGIDLATSLSAVQLADAHPNLYAAIGIHPTTPGEVDSAILSDLKTLAQNPKVIAIGEIGLDYYHEEVPHDQQKRVFQMQLELAAELDLPVIVHQRSSWEDLWPMLQAWTHQLKKLPPGKHWGVLHSFEGTLAMAQVAVDGNFLLGISGPITYRHPGEREMIVKTLKMDHFLLETDAPYLPPVPFRGKRNEPKYLHFIAEKMAEFSNISMEEIARITTENGKQLFNLGELV
jgi:TatD DNase family protein